MCLDFTSVVLRSTKIFFVLRTFWKKTIISFTEKLVAIVEIIEVKCEKSIEETEYVVTKINFVACLKLMIQE